MRLVASFLLLFTYTTSGDVLCSKFGWVWETLCIFKVARWTRNRWMEINKSLTVSNGIGASSFEIWTGNLAQLFTVDTLTNSWSFIFGVSNWKFCKVGYPIGTPKPDIQMRILLTCFSLNYFLCFYFCIKKQTNNKTCWIYKNMVFTNLEKYQVSQNLFGVYCWFLKLYTGIIWHSYFPLHGIL